LIPHFLSTAFLQKIGQLFVDEYCGSDMSGIYALANSLAMLMMVVNDALTKTLVPWTYEKLSEKRYKDINKPIVLSLALIAVIDIAMALVAPELVAIFADSNYAKAVYAIPPLVAVCFFGFLYNTFANIEYYYKETKMVSMASVIAGVVIIMANMLLVPKFGFIAAAYSSLISYIVYAIMHYLFMRRTLKKHLDGLDVYNNKLIFKMAIAFIAIILLVNVLYQFTIIRYTVIVFSLVMVVVKRKYLLGMVNSLFVKKEKKNVE
jgi:O-antigen/teichoic acid export membrane protein